MDLPVQPESQSRVAEQQQQCKNSLLEKRVPLIAGKRRSCTTGHGPRHEKVEDR
jgi:hypothetical protein